MTLPSDPSPSMPRDVRMRGFQDRTEVADALALLATRLQPLAAETVSLHDAAGRVLAADVTADVAVPSFDRAAMDGYALRGAETFGSSAYNPLEFAVVGISLPGRPFTGTSALGMSLVSGPRRVPSPPAGMATCIIARTPRPRPGARRAHRTGCR